MDWMSDQQPHAISGLLLDHRQEWNVIWGQTWKSQPLQTSISWRKGIPAAVSGFCQPPQIVSWKLSQLFHKLCISRSYVFEHTFKNTKKIMWIDFTLVNLSVKNIQFTVTQKKSSNQLSIVFSLVEALLFTIFLSKKSEINGI